MLASPEVFALVLLGSSKPTCALEHSSQFAVMRQTGQGLTSTSGCISTPHGLTDAHKAVSLSDVLMSGAPEPSAYSPGFFSSSVAIRVDASEFQLQSHRPT